MLNRPTSGAAVPGAAGRCPLCGQANDCAMAPGEGGRCWCLDAVFDAALLASVPASSAAIACVCAACVRQHRERPQS
jgi:cysteine-rich CWC protein